MYLKKNKVHEYKCSQNVFKKDFKNTCCWKEQTWFLRWFEVFKCSGVKCLGCFLEVSQKFTGEAEGFCSILPSVFFLSPHTLSRKDPRHCQTALGTEKCKAKQ